MEDVEILDLFFARNERALSETSVKYGTKLQSMSRYITGNENDAQECFNDTLFEAWRRIPPERPNCFFAYLAKITRNFSLKKWERLSAKKRIGTTAEITEELMECLPDSSSDIDEIVENKRLSEAIDSFVRTLKNEQRRMFMRRYFWNEPLSVIAKSEGCSEGSLKSLFHRLRLKLKEKLIKENFDL